MTRRAASRAGKVLSLNQYVHRATLGLPKTERLDAAAELRAHLLERVTELEQKGFARDEAEFLAVRAMGDPQTTNRGLLGHAFTVRLGWGVLAAALLGGGAWWAANNLMPPREGVAYTGSELTLEDLRALQADQDAPKGLYQTATIVYPKGTKTVYYVYMTPKSFNIQPKNLIEENDYNIAGQWPGSYRYQERVLINQQRGSKDCPQDWGLYVNLQVIPSRFWNGDGIRINRPGVGTNTSDGKSICIGLKRQYIQDYYPPPLQNKTFRVELLSPMEGASFSGLRPANDTANSLALNHWTILSQLGLNPRTAYNGKPPLKGRARGVYLAVLPSSQPAPAGSAGPGWKQDAQGHVSLLHYGKQALPDPPNVDWEHETQAVPPF